MTTLVLCGYQGSGKDTVYNDLIHESFWDHWIVLSKTGSIQDIKFTYKTNYIRIAFADKLKEYVMDKYEFLNPFIQKDDFIPTMNKTFRELLIEEAIETKKNNLNIWVEKALNPFTKKEKDICITDWRFFHEKSYIYNNFSTILTARVFREDVSIPDSPSEHELDYILTDFVILPNMNHFKKFIQVFPQYTNFLEVKNTPK